MITIFHGDDTRASRNAYLEARKIAQDVTILDGASITLTDLTQALTGEDLFGTSKHLFIEELFSKRKPSKELEEIQSSILHNKSSITLWESKELTAKQLSQFKESKINTFKIPSTIFTFLDGIKPKNGTNLIQLFHKTLQDKDVEFVLFMLTRHVRTLLAVKDQSVITGEAKQSGSTMNNEPKTTNTISEISRMAPWQKTKLEKQATLFTTDILVYLHQQLYKLDLAQKTGLLTLPLPDAIDFLLLSF